MLEFALFAATPFIVVALLSCQWIWAMWAKKSEVVAGTRLVADGGFICLCHGQVLTVEDDGTGDPFGTLFVQCRDGRHYLCGQLSDDLTEYVGLWIEGRVQRDILQ
jgi:hypothetical protein